MPTIFKATNYTVTEIMTSDILVLYTHLPWNLLMSYAKKSGLVNLGR